MCQTTGSQGREQATTTTYPLLRECRALDVLDGAKLTSETLAHLAGDRALLLSGELLADGLVIAQVDLCADNEAGHARAVVSHLQREKSVTAACALKISRMGYLGDPLLPNVLERCGRGDGEADEEDVCLRVRERAQAVVIFLAGRIEQAERVRVIANHDGHRAASD